MRIFERHPELLPVYHGTAKFPFHECYTVKNPGGAMAEEDVAAALIVAQGHYADAAKILRRSRQSLHNFVLRHQDVFDLREEIFESALDDVERVYMEAAIEGDGAAAKFFLSTRAKNRGYSTRVEHTGKDDGPVQVENVDPVEAARRAAFAMQLALRSAPDNATSKDSSEAPTTERTEDEPDPSSE